MLSHRLGGGRVGLETAANRNVSDEPTGALLVLFSLNQAVQRVSPVCLDLKQRQLVSLVCAE